MTDLIPLRNIPHAAREVEATERRKFATRDDALEAADLAIVLAPGCHNKPTAPVIGWVLTLAAAEALAARVTQMPGGTSHRRLQYEQR